MSDNLYDHQAVEQALQAWVCKQEDHIELNSKITNVANELIRAVESLRRSGDIGTEAKALTKAAADLDLLAKVLRKLAQADLNEEAISALIAIGLVGSDEVLGSPDEFQSYADQLRVAADTLLTGKNRKGRPPNLTASAVRGFAEQAFRELTNEEPIDSINDRPGRGVAFNVGLQGLYDALRIQAKA